MSRQRLQTVGFVRFTSYRGHIFRPKDSALLMVSALSRSPNNILISLIAATRRGIAVGDTCTPVSTSSSSISSRLRVPRASTSASSRLCLLSSICSDFISASPIWTSARFASRCALRVNGRIPVLRKALST